MPEFSTREWIDIQTLFESGGYVLDFGNDTFRAFVVNATEVDVYDEASTVYADLSKARRLRAFFRHETSYLSGKLLLALLEYIEAKQLAWDVTNRDTIILRLKDTADRLLSESPIDNLDAVEPFANKGTLSVLVSSIQESVRRNQPEAALDRLHTFLVRLLRDISDGHSISYTQETPLHSLMGGYRKYLRDNGLLKSEMTDRILSTALSLLDAYNKVRNDHSFAHANETLSRSESAFVVSAVLNVVKFISTIEQPPELEASSESQLISEIDDDIPF